MSGRTAKLIRKFCALSNYRNPKVYKADYQKHSHKRKGELRKIMKFQIKRYKNVD